MKNIYASEQYSRLDLIKLYVSQEEHLIRKRIIYRHIHTHINLISKYIFLKY